jgi:hypothetical protein
VAAAACACLAALPRWCMPRSQQHKHTAPHLSLASVHAAAEAPAAAAASVQGHHNNSNATARQRREGGRRSRASGGQECACPTPAHLCPGSWTVCAPRRMGLPPSSTATAGPCCGAGCVDVCARACVRTCRACVSVVNAGRAATLGDQAAAGAATANGAYMCTAARRRAYSVTDGQPFRSSFDRVCARSTTLQRDSNLITTARSLCLRFLPVSPRVSIHSPTTVVCVSLPLITAHHTRARSHVCGVVVRRPRGRPTRLRHAGHPTAPAPPLAAAWQQAPDARSSSQ